MFGDPCVGWVQRRYTRHVQSPRPPPTSPTALSCTHAQPAPPRKRQRQPFRTLISSMFHVACVDVVGVGVGVFVRSFAEVPCVLVLVLVLVVFCCFCLL